MPVPKRKRSRARRDSRFANKGLKIKALTTCTNCQDPLTPHQACKGCGHYKGAKVIRTKNDRLIDRTHTRRTYMDMKAKRASAEENKTPSE